MNEFTSDAYTGRRVLDRLDQIPGQLRQLVADLLFSEESVEEVLYRDREDWIWALDDDNGDTDYEAMIPCVTGEYAVFSDHGSRTEIPVESWHRDEGYPYVASLDGQLIAAHDCIVYGTYQGLYVRPRI